ncbi:SDR family NAD(P)-dependent oxidoreductase [Ralstonia holmesii]|uniref:SDR family NAD(P)-dependent oxidoreductase n=1 Tax=Ralstonia TaxID=48736 RepID=UPI00046AF847|nr:MULTISPECIES: SDR family oxidoreductase [Ralstonia]CAJ0691001.1 5-keto-D-gluconate 5-reductase [Ralstonia sp. LMG 32967]
MKTEARSLFDLSGHVALITGATSGLGFATATALATQGATVIVSGLDEAACSETATRLCQSGLNAFGIACDVSDQRQVEQLVGEVLQRHGRIDTLVCNAGIQGPAGPFSNVTDDTWLRVMEVNLHSAARLTSLVIPDMAQRGSGSVILMSSIAGLRGNRRIGLYGISKAGLAQLARNLAVEWGPHGVRVNAISPGLIRTPFAAELIADSTFMSRRLSLTPLRRVGEPHEIAGVAVMLASPAGGFMTGQNIVVDGGTTISDGS